MAAFAIAHFFYANVAWASNATYQQPVQQICIPRIPAELNRSVQILVQGEERMQTLRAEQAATVRQRLE